MDRHTEEIEHARVSSGIFLDHYNDDAASSHSQDSLAGTCSLLKFHSPFLPPSFPTLRIGNTEKRTFRDKGQERMENPPCSPTSPRFFNLFRLLGFGFGHGSLTRAYSPRPLSPHPLRTLRLPIHPIHARAHAAPRPRVSISFTQTHPLRVTI